MSDTLRTITGFSAGIAGLFFIGVASLDSFVLSLAGKTSAQCLVLTWKPALAGMVLSLFGCWILYKEPRA